VRLGGIALVASDRLATALVQVVVTGTALDTLLCASEALASTVTCPRCQGADVDADFPSAPGLAMLEATAAGADCIAALCP